MQAKSSKAAQEETPTAAAAAAASMPTSGRVKYTDIRERFSHMFNKGSDNSDANGTEANNASTKRVG